MDGIHSPRGSQNKTASQQAPSTKTDASYQSRAVQPTTPTNLIQLHPLILKNELKKSLGSRLITQLRELAHGQHSLRTVVENDICDEDLCHFARKISKDFEAAETSSDSDHFQKKLEEKLASSGNNEQRAALFRLLQVLASDEFAPDALQRDTYAVLEDIQSEHSPRAISIFLKTDFGKYVLKNLQQDVTLTKEEEHKMLSGLTHIKNRLPPHSKTPSDKTLIELANLFMGQKINLEKLDQMQDIASKTLTSIIENNQRSLETTQNLQKKIASFMASEAYMNYLPLSQHQIKAIPSPTIREFLQKLTTHPRMHKYLHNSELSSSTLQAVADNLQEAYQKTEERITRLKEQQRHCENLTGNHQEQLIVLSQILRESSDVTRAPIEKQTLALLRNHVDYQLLDNTRKKFQRELSRELSNLEDGGSEKTLSLSVNVGAALAAASISALELSGTLECSFTVSGNDDVRVWERSAIKPSLTLSCGDEKLAQTSLTAGYNHSKGRIFNNLEEFVHFHSNDLVPTLLTSLDNLPRNIKGSLDAHRATKLNKRIMADRHLLTGRLTQLGVILPGDQIEIEPDRAINYADFKEHTLRLEAAVETMAGLSSASLETTASKIKFLTHTELLSSLQNNPDKAAAPRKSYISYWIPATVEDKALYSKRAKSFNRTPNGTDLAILQEFKEEDNLVSRQLRGADAITYLQALEENLIQLHKAEQQPDLTDTQKEALKQDRLLIRDALKKAMVDQYLERKFYCDTVNTMEGQLGKNVSQKHFRNAKKSMEAVYKVNNRGAYLATHTYSFYHLHRLYEQTFIPSETPVLDDGIFQQVLDQHIKPSLHTPQIRLDATKHIRKHLMAKSALTSTSQTVGATLSLGIPKTDNAVSGDIVYTNVQRHVNPDNDGGAIDIGLNLGVGTNVAAVLKALKSALIKAKAKNGVLPAISLAELPEEAANLLFDKDVRLVLSFAECIDGWHLQYIRASVSKGIGIESPDIGIPTGPLGEIKLGISAKVSSVNNWWESPGSHTITYLRSKFNGWKLAKMIKTPSWENTAASTKEEQTLKEENPFHHYVLEHRKDISQMLINMGTENTNIAKELKAMITRFDTSDPLYTDDFSENFLNSLKSYAADPQPDKFKELVPMLERAFTLQHQAYLEEARSRYKTSFRKGRIV